MSEQELVKGLTYLGTVYNKEFTRLECEIHYDFLKEFKYEVFIQAIKNIIKKSKFLPKITELLEECESCKKKNTYSILIFMQSQGYFKEPSEYDKATKYLETGIIPNWFKEEMKKYYAMMKRQGIEQQDRVLIGG